uniref:Rhophilin Rho GTPase binding protein 1 n=1 Tax=Phocoena sinus TaxID=42100 RepID=A0A8C9CXA4_PHOSS
MGRGGYRRNSKVQEDVWCVIGHLLVGAPGWAAETQSHTGQAQIVPGAPVPGCDLLANSQHGCLQSRRAQIHQQINRELRMRTGAENLYRATSNARVRETVALELSYVNSSLQLLKEELEGLDGNVDADQPPSEGITVPMIPLGLKETKQLDWATPLKVRRCACHEVGWGRGTPLTSTRQAMRTPSRSEAGLELLTAYYNQLCFQEARFVTPARSLGLLFHWYDSLTGVPAQQRALAFEKGSVLFNIGALHTQIGARQDRSCPEGTSCAVEAFQRAAGAFSLLRENFSHAPSPDMSPASLSMLEQLMTAQAQECVFEGLLLQAPVAPHDCLAQLHLAQEAAQVAAEYRLVHQTMAQPPVRDYVPFPWTTLVHVKAEYFRALAHYHAALALCDGARESRKPSLALVSQHLVVGELGPSLEGPGRQRVTALSRAGKAHLKRAILGQEEALRLHAVCRALRRVDLLQVVLAQALRRSLAKYSELDLEDDFCEAAEAPDVRPKTQRRPEGRAPSFSRVKVADIFHRLGPLSVFSAKNRWRLAGPIHVARGEGGFGFTLRGDAPVLIAAVVPGGRAAAAGLKEGDYIVSVNGQPCRWWRHADVVAQLRGVGGEGVSLQVVTLLPGTEPPGSVSPGARGGPLTPCPAPAPGLPPSPPRPQMPGGHSGDLPGSSHLCCGLRLVAAPALDKAPAHPSAGFHPPGGPGAPRRMAALPGTPPRAPEYHPAHPCHTHQAGHKQARPGCRPIPISIPNTGGPPASPGGASEEPEGVWPGDTRARTSQPQTPPGLEPQGQEGQGWKEAVPSPTPLSRAAQAGSEGPALPTPQPQHRVQLTGSEDPMHAFLTPEHLRASLLPHPVPRAAH